MLNFLTNSLFFGVAVSLAAYEVGSLLKKKFKSPLLNPVSYTHLTLPTIA